MERVLRLQRYFALESASHQHFFINGEDRRHIVKVMRMQSGDAIICVNPQGKAAVCKIAEITDDQVVAEVVEWKDENTELPIFITIASGLPKGDKLEWVIQKGTELGAHKFLPFAAARSVVKWDEKREPKKLKDGRKSQRKQQNSRIAPFVLKW